MRKPLIFVCILVLAVNSFTGTVAAANNSTSQGTPVQETPEEGNGEFLNLSEEVEQAITSVLNSLVEELAEDLDAALNRIFDSYPDVKHPRVLELHQKTFQVSLVLASAAAVWIGVMHMFNRVDGIRQIVSLLAAVAFGAVAPDLLYYPVELSRLATVALAPAEPNLLEVSRFTIEYILVLFIDVFLLLGTVMIFLGRDVFLMLGVIFAPLIALMAVTPKLRGFADMLTSIWVGCLLIGPLDVVVLDLTLSFMGTDILVPGNYLWGLAGIGLLFGLPLILLGAGAVGFAPLTSLAARSSRVIQPRIRRYAKEAAVGNIENEQQSRGWEDRRNRRNRFRRDRGGD